MRAAIAYRILRPPETLEIDPGPRAEVDPFRFQERTLQ